jgi:hypothetical protein
MEILFELMHALDLTPVYFFTHPDEPNGSTSCPPLPQRIASEVIPKTGEDQGAASVAQRKTSAEAMRWAARDAAILAPIGSNGEASLTARRQGQQPSISVSSEKLRNVRITTMPPSKPTLSAVGGDVGADEKLEPQQNAARDSSDTGRRRTASLLS